MSIHTNVVLNYIVHLALELMDNVCSFNACDNTFIKKNKKEIETEVILIERSTICLSIREKVVKTQA